ncbi:hypothetical protein WRSd3_p00339 (plasmid) [Shigella dysenteriae WRSd3]|uniref:Uncharacterized protein n=1 Tax=Shigella dysenteriae WRSd3 TaxID=1401327 RepID=A0A090N9J7_SHIDY|nr:hypothetical protein WRSd3_p00339 [Shigella dysenteriae WRSd3]
MKLIIFILIVLIIAALPFADAIACGRYTDR